VASNRKQRPKKPRRRLGWRDAGTGQFVSEGEAKQKPKDTVVHERIPLPGKGTSKK
jgi:hypothetical protein